MYAHVSIQNSNLHDSQHPSASGRRTTSFPQTGSSQIDIVPDISNCNTQAHTKLALNSVCLHRANTVPPMVTAEGTPLLEIPRRGDNDGASAPIDSCTDASSKQSDTPRGSASYIAHLDGLRAVAITAVLLFHLKVNHISGGFLGVDMFFTISGYLITRNILHAVLVKDDFSLPRFYLRRFFRLYPAALVTIIFTLITCFTVVHPIYTKSVFDSATAALTFWSNIYFYRQGDYFYQGFEMRPLLHFWSLSVEEQFYFIWPVIIMIMSKLFRNNLNILAVIIGFLSFASIMFSAFTHPHNPSHTFYLLPSRIFQFGAGALLSLYQAHRADHSQTDASTQSATENSDSDDMADLLSFAAFVVLIISFVSMPHNPQPFLLVPLTVATLYLIASPNVILNAHVLASPPIVAVGRVSYSLYLVHWPLIMLGLFIGKGFGIPTSLAYAVVIALTAWTSIALYKHVETPLRHSRRPQHILAIFGLLAATLAFSIGADYTNGYAFRFPNSSLLGYPKSVTHPSNLFDVCRPVSNLYPRAHGVSVCRLGNPRAPFAYYHVFGDSFAEHLQIAFYEIALKENIQIDVHFTEHCGFRPASEVGPTSVEGYQCADVHNTLWKHVEQLPPDTTIVVSNWWNTVDRLPSALWELKEGVEKLNKTLVLVSETPGVHEDFGGYYTCADVHSMPLGRFLTRLFGQPYTGGARCIDISRGLPPEWMIGLERSAYDQAFQNAVMNDTKLIDPFSHLCHETTDLEDLRVEYHYRCRLPAHLEQVVYDIGYDHDLSHLSAVGSYYMTSFLHGQLHPQNS